MGGKGNGMIYTKLMTVVPYSVGVGKKLELRRWADET